MKYSEGNLNRVFVIRLEDGDRLPDSIEKFALKQKVSRGFCIIVGGVGGGKLVVGPEESEKLPPEPVLFSLDNVHEIAGVGTIFPDEKGIPRLHMHAALGRKGITRTGCIRPGIEIWKVGEIILLEITGNTAFRIRDKKTGFELLQP